MPQPASRPPRSRAERLAAWALTGPLGHLYSAAADLAAYLARSRLASLQRRLAGAGSRRSARR